MSALGDKVRTALAVSLVCPAVVSEERERVAVEPSGAWVISADVRKVFLRQVADAVRADGSRQPLLFGDVE